MANVYVDSNAVGAGTGADWANAYTTLDAACTAKAAGDVFWVAHNHAQTQASALTITSPGTETTPCKIMCVSSAGSVPPVAADLATTATITTTGAFGITISGTISECYGITFKCGTGASAANLTVNGAASKTQRYLNCGFQLITTAATSRITMATSTAATIWENCTVQFGSTSQGMNTSNIFKWLNTPSAVTGATLPTTLLLANTSGVQTWFEGVDLSALGSGKTLWSSSTSRPNCILVFKDCKLGSSVTVTGNETGVVYGNMVDLIRCDSGDTNYRTERYRFAGTQTTETTIVRTGGASDGTTPIAWKFVTTANSNFGFPFESFPITVWNETVGSSVTVTLQGIWGGGAVPTNDQIWFDLEYLGTSGYPLASKATSGPATSLTTGSNYAAGSGTWGGSTTKFAMSATFTPQEKGPFTIYVKVAKPSDTFYIDPKPVIT